MDRPSTCVPMVKVPLIVNVACGARANSTVNAVPAVVVPSTFERACANDNPVQPPAKVTVEQMSNSGLKKLTVFAVVTAFATLAAATPGAMTTASLEHAIGTSAVPGEAVTLRDKDCRYVGQLVHQDRDLAGLGAKPTQADGPSPSPQRSAARFPPTSNCVRCCRDPLPGRRRRDALYVRRLSGWNVIAFDRGMSQAQRSRQQRKGRDLRRMRRAPHYRLRGRNRC